MDLVHNRYQGRVYARVVKIPEFFKSKLMNSNGIQAELQNRNVRDRFLVAGKFLNVFIVIEELPDNLTMY